MSSERKSDAPAGSDEYAAAALEALQACSAAVAGSADADASAAAAAEEPLSDNSAAASGAGAGGEDDDYGFGPAPLGPPSAILMRAEMIALSRRLGLPRLSASTRSVLAAVSKCYCQPGGSKEAPLMKLLSQLMKADHGDIQQSQLDWPLLPHRCDLLHTCLTYVAQPHTPESGFTDPWMWRSLLKNVRSNGYRFGAGLPGQSHDAPTIFQVLASALTVARVHPLSAHVRGSLMELTEALLEKAKDAGKVAELLASRSRSALCIALSAAGFCDGSYDRVKRNTSLSTVLPVALLLRRYGAPLGPSDAGAHPVRLVIHDAGLLLRLLLADADLASLDLDALCADACEGDPPGLFRCGAPRPRGGRPAKNHAHEAVIQAIACVTSWQQRQGQAKALASDENPFDPAASQEEVKALLQAILDKFETPFATLRVHQALEARPKNAYKHKDSIEILVGALSAPHAGERLRVTDTNTTNRTLLFTLFDQYLLEAFAPCEGVLHKLIADAPLDEWHVDDFEQMLKKHALSIVARDDFIYRLADRVLAKQAEHTAESDRQHYRLRTLSGAPHHPFVANWFQRLSSAQLLPHHSWLTSIDLYGELIAKHGFDLLPLRDGKDRCRCGRDLHSFMVGRASAALAAAWLTARAGRQIDWHQGATGDSVSEAILHWLQTNTTQRIEATPDHLTLLQSTEAIRVAFGRDRLPAIRESLEQFLISDLAKEVLEFLLLPAASNTGAGALRRSSDSAVESFVARAQSALHDAEAAAEAEEEEQSESMMAMFA